MKNLLVTGGCGFIGSNYALYAPQRVEKLLPQLKGAEKEIGNLKSKISSLATEKTGDDFETINGVKVLIKKVEAESPAALRALADRFKDQMSSGVVVLGAVASGKALLIW